jgi:putative Mg2+ transporter-C (MgtC) family protein
MDAHAAQELVRLLVSFLLGGLIGLERELDNQPAGLRTHMLVAGGAACFVLASLFGFAPPQGSESTDVSRVASQVVVGVGFLGAGAIWRTGASVRGLTTAASIWMAASIGMLSATGNYLIAAVATVVVVVILHFLKIPERQLTTGDGEAKEPT